MRKFLALVLLAGAATPALAAGGPRDTIRSITDRDEPREARAEARSERSEVRAEAPRRDDTPRAVRSERVERPRPAVQVDSNAGGGEQRFGRGLRGRMTGGEAPTIQPVGSDDSRPAEIVRTPRGPRVIEAPQAGDGDRGTPALRQSTNRLPSVFRNRVPIVSNTPREGTQPPQRAENRRSNWASWSTSRWRGDHRYNWREHRRRHRSLFRLGFYYDPFGWNYRPYQIGWRLWPSYYSSRYWINDPWQYRLPYAPPGYRWVRYHDDAILVDTWSGQVVDVIYSFFW